MFENNGLSIVPVMERIRLEFKIERIYESCKENKKFKHTNQAKINWYYQRLKERIKHRVYYEHQSMIFNSILQYCDANFCQMIEDSFNQFVDVKDVKE